LNCRKEGRSRTPNTGRGGLRAVPSAWRNRARQPGHFRGPRAGGGGSKSRWMPRVGGEPATLQLALGAGLRALAAPWRPTAAPSCKTQKCASG